MLRDIMGYWVVWYESLEKALRETSIDISVYLHRESIKWLMW